MMRNKKHYINQYIRTVEPMIGEVIVHEQLHAALVDVILGCMTLTFQLRLLRPTVAQINKAESLGRVFEQVLAVSPVRVVNSPMGVLVEIPNPVPMTPSALQLCKENRGLNVAVGYDSFMRPARVKLWDHGALYWVGPSRHGKTQSMKSTLYQLALQKRVLFLILCLDGKLGDWMAFHEVQNCMGIVIDPKEQVVALEYVRKVFLKNTTGYDLVVLVDDLMALLEEARLSPHLKKLASTGAGLGVHLLVGTQNAGSKTSSGGTDVESNISARIVYRATSSMGAARSSGQGKSKVQELSGKKGDGLLIDGSEVTRITTGFARDAWIKDWKSGSNPYRYGWHSTRLTPVNSQRVEPSVDQQPSTPMQQPQQLSTPATQGVKTADLEPDAGDLVEDVVMVARVEVPLSVAKRCNTYFPIKRRPLEYHEERVINQLRGLGASWKQLSLLVYGQKDGYTDNWVKTACGESKKQLATKEALKDHG